MPWKRGNPGCPCCIVEPPPPPCACPGGGASKKFVGTPTVMVEVEGLPSNITWDCVYSIQPFIGGAATWFWTTIEINDLDAINGTYSYTLSKTVGDCVNFSQRPGTDFTLPSISSTITIRNLGTATSGCTINSTTTGASLTPSLSVSRNPFSYTSAYGAAFSLSMSQQWSGTNMVVFTIQGGQYMLCEHDYDPSLTPGSIGVGAIPGPPTAIRPRSSTEIWLNRWANPGGRCYSAEARPDYEHVGNIYAEIIDDVP